MLVAAAFCPHPPLLVPEAAGGAVGELQALREASVGVVEAMLSAEPQTVVVLGSGATPGELPDTAWGSLRPYGVPVDVVPPAADLTHDPALPLSLTVGAWLLGQAGWTGRTRWVCTGLSAGATTVAAGPHGPSTGVGGPRDGGGGDESVRGLDAGDGERVAVLAMGEGSARRLATGPGGEDPDAAGYDELVVKAIACGDSDALLEMDPAEGDRLLVTGLGPWRTVATAAQGHGVTADLRYAGTPYGVTYLAAHWELS